MARTSDDAMSMTQIETMARDLIVQAAANMSSININMDAALYRTADQMGLGELKTDELRFNVGDDVYIAQGFTDGILYVKDGDWGNIRKLDWPAATASAGSGSGLSAGDSGSTLTSA